MSEYLPLLSGSEVIKALHRLGYYVKRQRGSHVRLYHKLRKPVTVPMHKELDRKTLKAILRVVDIPAESFKELL